MGGKGLNFAFIDLRVRVSISSKAPFVLVKGSTSQNNHK